MTPALSRKIEVGANATIILSGLLIAIYFVRPNWLPIAHETGPIPAGTKLEIPSVNWKDYPATLVVAVREGCPYCERSAPFYKRLAAAAAKDAKTHVLATLPEPASSGKAYFDRLRVPFDDIRQSDLQQIDVRYTPTLILVDGDGKVKRAWIGLLHDREERDVLKATGLASN